MKQRLLDLLICPACGGSFSLETSDVRGDETMEGALRCDCGETYPIVRGIPRVYPGAFAEHRPRSHGDGPADQADGAQEQTRRSFGYQWTHFHEMHPEFEQNFLNYVHPVPPSFFPGKLGLDAGCGFGRHIYYAASYGAEMVGVDYSAAIESSARNAGQLPGVHLVQADIYRLPFRPNTFDFAYSLGVLHHLPDPLKGYRALASVVKPGGSLFVWLYSKTRRFINTVLEGVRRITPRLPYRTLRGLCFTAAAIDWTFFIYPYRQLSRISSLRQVLDRVTFARVKVYAQYPFQVCYADWFDRLSPPIRFYYDEGDLKGWAEAVSLREVRITPTGQYGWRLHGQLPNSP